MSDFRDFDRSAFSTFHSTSPDLAHLGHLTNFGPQSDIPCFYRPTTVRGIDKQIELKYKQGDLMMRGKSPRSDVEMSRN